MSGRLKLEEEMLTLESENWFTHYGLQYEHIVDCDVR